MSRERKGRGRGGGGEEEGERDMMVHTVKDKKGYVHKTRGFLHQN